MKREDKVEEEPLALPDVFDEDRFPYLMGQLAGPIESELRPFLQRQSAISAAVSKAKGHSLAAPAEGLRIKRQGEYPPEYLDMLRELYDEVTEEPPVFGEGEEE